MKTALTIAGSDSCGGAGIQADLKVFGVLGVYGMSALTAVTAQNTQGVEAAVALDAGFVSRQIDVVARDIHIDACKTGMLADPEVVTAVAEAIRRNRLYPYVCDPVMFAKSGDRLLKDEAVDAVKRLLLPMAAVVTPNRREAAFLAGMELGPITLESAREAARRIAAMGAGGVIIKGFERDRETVCDLFFDGQDYVELVAAREAAGRNHGSGCAFSAAITAGLASGLSAIDAIRQARALVTMAIHHSQGLGHGTAPVNVLAFKPGGV